MPYQILNRPEIEILALDLLYQTQAADLRRRNARGLQDCGPGEKKSLKVVVPQPVCSLKLRFGLDLLGYQFDALLTVAACNCLLLGVRGLQKVNFQNVNERG